MPKSIDLRFEFRNGADKSGGPTVAEAGSIVAMVVAVLAVWAWSGVLHIENEIGNQHDRSFAAPETSEPGPGQSRADTQLPALQDLVHLTAARVDDGLQDLESCHTDGITLRHVSAEALPARMTVRVATIGLQAARNWMECLRERSDGWTLQSVQEVESSLGTGSRGVVQEITVARTAP